MIALVLCLVVGLSCLITMLVRSSALQHNLIDIPNERSSHKIPTPRGGGLGIVLAFFVGVVLLWLQELIFTNIMVGFLGAGSLIAFVGFIDDRRSLSPRVRVLAHFSGSIWLLVWIGGMPALDLGFTIIEWGLIGHMIGVIGLVWMINLYNFMDGIDGLAGSEAVFVGTAAGVLILSTTQNNIGWLAILLAAASLGFLFWNWPPAKIFMGDVGSGFLGLMLGGVAITSANEADFSLFVWLLLLAVFVFDATFTLIKRIIRREKVWEAHRSHLYQQLAKRVGHLATLLIIIFINLGLLLSLIFMWNY